MKALSVILFITFLAVVIRIGCDSDRLCPACRQGIGFKARKCPECYSWRDRCKHHGWYARDLGCGKCER